MKKKLHRSKLEIILYKAGRAHTS